MVFFTNSTLHMLAHGIWAQVLMLAGATELALVRGKVRARGGGSAWRPRSSSPALRSSSTSRTTGSSSAPRSCITCSAGRCSSARSSRSPAAIRPRSQVAATGFALTFVVARGAALLRPRRRSGLRAHLAARGDAAPMRRAAARRARLALAFPALRVRARDARASVPGIPRAPAVVAARRSSLRFDQYVKAVPGSIRVYSAKRQRRCHATCASDRSCRRRGAAAPARGARTRCAGTSCRATAHVVSGVFTFGVRAARAAADRGVRRVRADARGARRALALLPLARPASSAGWVSASSSCALR